MKTKHTLIPLACAMTMLGTDVLAQAIDEVVVTARKREESLQETPVSVMAFGGDDLAQQNVSDLKGLDIKLPNVAIGGAGGVGGTNAAFYVRGIGTSRNAVNQESAVALYVDDAYYGRSDGALLAVMDVAQIEVSRGPQGTLFGRSATAGAIRYITNKPNYDELEGKIEATLGSENRRDLKGVINVPLGDAAAVRVTAATLNQDGYVDGFFSGKDYGDVGSDMVRTYFGWQATNDLEILASVDYTRMDSNGGASTLLAVDDSHPRSLIPAEAAAGFDARTLPVGEYDTSFQAGDNFYESDNIGLALTFNWTLSDSLDFKSSTNWRDADIEGAYDTDATHAILSQQGPFERDLNMFSQEFQLSGTSVDDALNWVGGVFYYNEESTETRLVQSGVNAGIPMSSTRITNPYEVESLAAFGQGTYDLTDTWSVTAGLRYTRDEKTITADELNAAGVSKMANLGGPVTRDDTWSAVSGRLSLEWQAAEDIFLFGSYARGFRAGGFNDRIRTNLPNDFFGITDFDEEVLDMYELGIRSEFFDHRVRLNLTAFYGEFSDMQISTLLPGTNRAVVKNAGEAELKGIEGELIWAINDVLTLDSTFGLLDTEYTKLNPTVTSVTLDSDFARAPEASFSLGLEADLGEVVGRIDYGWKDDFRTVEGDSTHIAQAAYGLLSANITYAPEGANWSISVFGTNLTDEEYIVSGISLLNTPFGITQAEPGRFREVGVKFGWEI